MSLSSRTRGRRWRSALAGVAAAALALTGLATTPASAAANITASISPASVTAGSTGTSYVLTFTGGSSQAAKSFTVEVPTGFSAVTVGTVGGTAGGNWQASFDSSTDPDQIKVQTKTGSVNALADGATVTVAFSATAPSAAGSATFATSFHTNRSFNGAGSGPIGSSPSVSVTSAAQAITFGSLPDRTFGDADFTVSATGGGSGNPVTFTAAGNCTAGGTNGATIHLTGAGSCTVTAHQAAGSGYTAATPVERSFTIDKADQTVTLDPISTRTFGDGAVDVVASASSGLPVTLGASGPCSLSGATLTLTGAGDCTVTADQPGDANHHAAAQQSVTFTINKATAVLSLGDLGPYTFDGDPHAASATTVPADLSGVTLTYDGSTTAPTAAGSYDVEATLDNADYEAEAVDGTLVIEPRSITGAFTVAGKTYDAGTDAEITGCSLPSGLVDGYDDVSLDCTGATATFDSKNAGSRTATLSGASLTGADAGNYSLGGVETATATIDPKPVTGAILAQDKTYDGDDDAVASLDEITGMVGGDDLDLDISGATFDSADAGPRTVTATIALSGADAPNYVLTSTTATAAATIWQKELTPSVAVADKVYDGTISATLSDSSLSGIVGSDDVSLVVAGAEFPSKDVGAHSLGGGLSLTGAKSGNYQLTTDTWSASAAITPLSVTASFTAADKVWDGTTAATINGRSLTGAITGDDVALTGGSATFDTAAVGTGKTVTATGFGLTGVDAGNYVLSAGPWTTTASISPLYSGKGFYAPVDMTAVGGTRVYNTIKGGQTVPLKFEIFNAAGTVEQTTLSVFGADAAAQAAAFRLSQVACTATSASDDAIEVVTTGGTSLRYDGSGGQYIQNWKTPTGVNTCWAVSVKTVDGTTVGPAYFKITK